jgi:hypothetical protein
MKLKVKYWRTHHGIMFFSGSKDQVSVVNNQSNINLPFILEKEIRLI